MEVQRLSKKFIKPSAPTPSHLRNFKLSFMDQLALPVYVDIILYYPMIDKVEDPLAENTQRRSRMEKSLAETLTIFYPLAGRYTKGDLFFDCNDEGVAYMEAQVNAELAQVLYGKSGLELLNKFVPCDAGEADVATTPFVSIQVNSFSCGGLAVCVHISHRIADGSTMAAFVEAWATASRAGIDEVIRPSFDLASHIPARVSFGPPLPPPPPRKNTTKIVTRRLVFDGEAILRLKAKLGCQTSRVEAVTAVIWRALIRVARENPGQLRIFQLEHSVNLRGKTIPPMPRNTFANFIALAVPRIMANDMELELAELVKLIHNAIRSNTNKALHSEEFFTMVSDTFREIDMELNPEEVDHRMFTSWCKFPLYDADFGWGKPCWVSSVTSPEFELTILMDTKDGDGIEAWVSLDEPDMLQFQLEDQNIKT